MKKLFLTIIGLLAFVSFTQAQFLTAKATGPALPGNFILGSQSAATNVSGLGYAPAFPVNGNGTVGLYLEMGATNDFSSNIHLYFDYSFDGQRWFGSSATAISAALGATTIATPTSAGGGLITPVFGDYVTAASSLASYELTNFSLVRYVRLRSITNYTAGQISNWYTITNAIWIQENRD